MGHLSNSRERRFTVTQNKTSIRHMLVMTVNQLVIRKMTKENNNLFCLYSVTESVNYQIVDGGEFFLYTTVLAISWRTNDTAEHHHFTNCNWSRHWTRAAADIKEAARHCVSTDNRTQCRLRGGLAKTIASASDQGFRSNRSLREIRKQRVLFLEKENEL